MSPPAIGPTVLEQTLGGRLFPAVCKLVIVWVVFSLFGEQLSRAFALGNDLLTDSGDAYSEANDVRAGESYADQGLTSNVGLPEISYGTKFEYQGGKHDNLLCESSIKCVYLHYPPGPELAMGAMTRVFGKGHLFAYRVVPLVVGLLALCALGAALIQSIGPFRAAVVMWLLGKVPMTSNMMHVFTTHSWSQAFFLLEVAALLVALSRPTTRNRHLWAVGLAAFCEGWTAFDYVFLVALSPLAVFLAQKDIRNPESRRRLRSPFVVAAGAYATAILLHFVHVPVFLGGIRHQSSHLSAAAKNRSFGATWVKPPVGGGLGNILYYWTTLLPDKK